MYLNRNISLGMQSEYLLLQRIWKIRRKRSAAGLQEVLETRSRAICLEVFRKPIIRTEDICWITRSHCSPCLKSWMERAVFWM